MVYSPKPGSDVFCFKLNFKISKLGYYIRNLVPSAFPFRKGKALGTRLLYTKF